MRARGVRRSESSQWQRAGTSAPSAGYAPCSPPATTGGMPDGAHRIETTRSVFSDRAASGTGGGDIRTPRAVSILVGRTLASKTCPRSRCPADGTIWRSVRSVAASNRLGGFEHVSLARGQPRQHVDRTRRGTPPIEACSIAPCAIWSGREDSNLRPPEPHSGALPGCATPR